MILGHVKGLLSSHPTLRTVSTVRISHTVRMPPLTSFWRNTSASNCSRVWIYALLHCPCVRFIAKQWWLHGAIFTIGEHVRRGIPWIFYIHDSHPKRLNSSMLLLRFIPHINLILNNHKIHIRILNLRALRSTQLRKASANVLKHSVFCDWVVANRWAIIFGDNGIVSIH